MEQAIASYTVSSRYAVAVTDLQTGETLSVNGDRKQLAGCAMNLFVLFQLSIDMHEGRYATESIDSSTLWSAPRPGAATRRPPPTFMRSPETAMSMSVSAGWMRSCVSWDSRIQRWITRPFTQSSRGSWRQLAHRERGKRGSRRPWQGDLLTPEWRDYLLSRLATVKPGLNYLTGMLASSGAVVSHKNGFFEYDEGFVDNDLGIVRFRRGGHEVEFAITFLS
jgi:hypothetical protein